MPHGVWQQVTTLALLLENGSWQRPAWGAEVLLSWEVWRRRSSVMAWTQSRSSSLATCSAQSPSEPETMHGHTNLPLLL